MSDGNGQSAPKKRRIYSRRGDLGETSLFSGPRVGKDQCRIVACGTLDELSAFLGLARAEGLLPEIDKVVRTIQTKLFEVNTEIVAMTPAKHEVKTIQKSDITRIEKIIDKWEEKLPALSDFIVPGDGEPGKPGVKGAAILHVARTVCRRVERRVVALVRHDETVSKNLMAWLNRLADLLFVLARAEKELRN